MVPGDRRHYSISEGRTVELRQGPCERAACELTLTGGRLLEGLVSGASTSWACAESPEEGESSVQPDGGLARAERLEHSMRGERKAWGRPGPRRPGRPDEGAQLLSKPREAPGEKCYALTQVLGRPSWLKNDSRI